MKSLFVISMFDFPELNAMLSKFGGVTCYNFFAYGNLTDEEVQLLVDGTKIRLLQAGFESNIMVFSSYVDEELATLFNHYQGTTVTIALAGKARFEHLIKRNTMDGFKFLRYRADYHGEVVSESHV